jgi:hypothetical protein
MKLVYHKAGTRHRLLTLHRCRWRRETGQPHPVRLGARIHSGMAPDITRSRSAGCKLASVTTSLRRPGNSCASTNRPPKASALMPGCQGHEKINVAGVVGVVGVAAVATAHRTKDPNTRTLVTPRRCARASSSARWVSMSGCMGFSLGAFCGAALRLKAPCQPTSKPRCWARALAQSPRVLWHC